MGTRGPVVSVKGATVQWSARVCRQAVLAVHEGTCRLRLATLVVPPPPLRDLRRSCTARVMRASDFACRAGSKVSHEGNMLRTRRKPGVRKDSRADPCIRYSTNETKRLGGCNRDVGVRCDSACSGAMEYDVLMVARLLFLRVGSRESQTGLKDWEAGRDDR